MDAFGGGANVLLRKERCYAECFNDLDGEVVNFFQVLRDRGAELLSSVELTPFARTEFLRAYEEHPAPLERARRLAIRSFMGHGSGGTNPKNGTGFRANTTRSGTIPAHDWRSYPWHIPSLTERFRGVVIENRPALQVLEKFDGPETLHYVDPPYPHETRNSHRQSYRHEMTMEQHRELLAFCRQLRGQVVVSSYGNSLYREMLADWNVFQKSTMADGAAPRIEMIWTNR